MAEEPVDLTPIATRDVDLGGLRFAVSFRGEVGATLRVLGNVDNGWKELLRFDDFVEAPHYHVPADASATMFDRALGDPLEWYLAQLRDNLTELLDRGGFHAIAETIDARAIAAGVDQLRDAVAECVPDTFVRVPGVGLRPA
jgi:hypothetical protein